MHWLLDLFKSLKLAIFDGMKEGLEKANRDRMHRLGFKKKKKKKWREPKTKKRNFSEQGQRAKCSFKMGQKAKKKIQHDYDTNIMVEESHDPKGPLVKRGTLQL